MADLVVDKYAPARRITLVQDNPGAHKPSAMYELFPPEMVKATLDRIGSVNTPKHEGWLNMAEIEIGVLKQNRLSDTVASKGALTGQVRRFEERRDRGFEKVNWQFTTEDARVKLRGLCPIIEESTDQI